MIDASLSLLDKLIGLLTIRQTRKQDYFDRFIEPIFQDAELIVKDYVGLFAELIAKLERGDSVSDVTRWIEDRRLLLLPVRIKIRALLKEGAIGVRNPMDSFEQGLWGVMKGGISLVETGHAQLREYGFGDHTVLDLLKRLRGEPASEARRILIRNAKAQLRCVELAWMDAVRGYATLKKSAHPRR
jgi:hypothetical protein